MWVGDSERERDAEIVFRAVGTMNDVRRRLCSAVASARPFEFRFSDSFILEGCMCVGDLDDHKGRSCSSPDHF